MVQLITPATNSPRCIGRDIAFSNSVWTAASKSAATWRSTKLMSFARFIY